MFEFIYFCASIFIILLNVKTNLSQDRPQCGISQVNRTQLIVQGHDTAPGAWPWHAAIYHRNGRSSKYACGGTLISEQYVLTAAHCVFNPENNFQFATNRMFVRLGVHNLFVLNGQTLQQHEIHRIYTPQNYTGGGFRNDIAILELSTLAQYTEYVQPACISTVEDLTDQFGTAIGWGVTEDDEGSQVLKSVALPVIDSMSCLRSNRDVFGHTLDDDLFCAGFTNGTTVCNGDSGGGIFFKSGNAWYLGGIVSYAQKREDNSNLCHTAGYAGFTKVIRYADWITKLTGLNLMNSSRSNELHCPKGCQGMKGEPGVPGQPGPRGPPGVSDSPREMGDTGTEGRSGLDGLLGIYGHPGIYGLPGTPGMPGTPGNPGPRGLKGAQGIPGIAGEKGATGNPGTEGRPGRDGLPGRPGPAGPRGPPGPPGKSSSRLSGYNEDHDGVRSAADTIGTGLPGPKGSKGDMGRPGSPCTRDTLHSSCPSAGSHHSGILLVRHSQSEEVPQCSEGHTKLWDGYSLLYAYGGEGYPFMQSSSSCIQKFSRRIFLACDTDSQCSIYGTYWLSTMASIPRTSLVDDKLRSYISRCVVCETPSNAIAVHSQSATIPDCPNGWDGLWIGYSFLMPTASGHGNGGALSDPGSCLEEFRESPIVECDAQGIYCRNSGATLRIRSFWLMSLDNWYTNSNNNNFSITRASTISKCQVCIRSNRDNFET